MVRDVPALALLWCPLAAALTLRGVEPTPIVFPRGRDVPRNGVFHVLWPEGPEAAWLEDDRGRRVLATRRRRALSDGRAYTELRPLRVLAPNRKYCVVVREGGATMDECVLTSDTTDRTAPSGGAPTGVRIAGGEVWIDIERGVEASETALQVEVRSGGHECHDLTLVPRSYLRFGVTVDLFVANGRIPGDGTYCFEELPHPTEAATLRVRWIDAAGNVGPWSAEWELPAGLSASTTQTFHEGVAALRGHAIQGAIRRGHTRACGRKLRGSLPRMTRVAARCFRFG